MYEVRSENPDALLPPGRYALVLKGLAYDFTVAGPITDPRQCLERLVATNGRSIRSPIERTLASKSVDLPALREAVRQQLLLALGIEPAICCHQPLQALPGIGDRTCNTEIVGKAFKHKRVAARRQWSVRIFAPDFVHFRIVLSRRRSIRHRNISHNPIVIDRQ